jgi:hypothetical protein
VEINVYETLVVTMQNAVTPRVVLSALVCLDAQVTPIEAVSVKGLRRTCVETNSVELMLLVELLTTRSLNVTALMTIPLEIHISNVRSFEL